MTRPHPRPVRSAALGAVPGLRGFPAAPWAMLGSRHRARRPPPPSCNSTCMHVGFPVRFKPQGHGCTRCLGSGSDLAPASRALRAPRAMVVLVPDLWLPSRRVLLTLPSLPAPGPSRAGDGPGGVGTERPLGGLHWELGSLPWCSGVFGPEGPPGTDSPALRKLCEQGLL